jgi:hypothetical protein
MIRTTIRQALLLAAAAALSAPAFAEPQDTFSIVFKWDRRASAEANYNAFRRLAARECEGQGLRPLQVRLQERACTDDIMDRFVVEMGRADIAVLHTARTGRDPIGEIDFASRG